MSKKYYGKPEVVESYKKELARIKRQIKSMQNRGFIIDESIIPKTPKTIKPESVRNLKKITSKSLYEKSQYYNEADQEIISGKVARGYERRTSAQKGNITKEYNEIEQYYSDLLEELNPELETLEEFREKVDNYEPQPTEDDYSWVEDNYSGEYEPEPPTIDDADDFRPGSIDNIERVREQLRNLPYIFGTRFGRYSKADMWVDINRLFDERVESYSGKDYDECSDYLSRVKNVIDHAIEDLNHASDANDIDTAYGKIEEAIKGMPLSREEREYAGEVSDYTNNWNESE